MLKKITGSKLLNFLLALATVIVLMPGMSLTAYADNQKAYAAYDVTTNDNKTKSGDALTALQVKFNEKSWYIIADNSTAVDAGTVTLLAADASFGTSKFHDSSNAYSSSTVKGVLDALTAEGGAFASVKGAIADTNLSDVSVTGAKLYLLNITEANNVPMNVRKFSNDWWLRSPVIVGHAASVNINGYVQDASGYPVDYEGGVRPALKLNLSSVIFSSKGLVTLSGGANATCSGSNPIEDNTFYLNNEVPEVSYTYTANTDYCFEPFSPITSSGVTASRSVDGTKVTVSGRPTGHVNITIPDAVLSHNHSFTYSAEGATITATCSASGCPLPGSKTTLTIVKPARTVYGGSESAEATFEGTIPGVTPTAKYFKGTEELSAAPTNAGTYKAQVTLKGTDEEEATASVEYTIAKADITPVVSIEGWTYGEQAKTPSVTSGNPGSGDVTYKYYTNEGCTKETSEAEGATASGGVPSYSGYYWVKATVAETDNYKSDTGKKGFTIEKASVTVSGITASNKIYDGNTNATINTENATFVGKLDGDKLTVSTTGSFESKDVGTNKTVNLGTLTLGGTSAGNYKLAETGQQSTAKANITKRPVKVSGITASNKIYDGTASATLVTGSATLTGKVEGDTLSVTANGAFSDANVGTGKTVTISGLALAGADKDNYVLAATGQQTEAEADITKKTVNVTAEAKSKAYGEDDPALTYTADDLCGSDKFTGALTRAEGEDAGTYDINQGTLSAGNNYTIKYTKGTFTINKATTNSVTATIEGWIYGDDPNEPTATGKHGAGTATFTYSKTADGEYTGTVPTEAGTWYVKATVAETDNYVGAVSEPAEFKIAEKEVGLEWTDTEFTYDGAAHKPTATATGLVGEDKCEVTVGGAQTDANVKTGTDYYEAEAKALSNDNYKLPEKVKTKFTIAPKKLTQSMISLESDTIKHDGSEKGPEVTMTDKDITEGEQPKQMAKGEDYTLSGDVSSSELGTHVITAEGKGNYTGSIETSWMMYSKKSNDQKEEGTGDRGDFEVFVDVENNSSDLAVDNLTVSLAKGFLTEEDMARYNEGENVLVYMILKEQPKSETGAGDRYILGQLFREEGATDISWYDITVWKKIGNSPATRVHDTGKEILMSVEVPDGQKNAPEGYTREFYMGRSHDGASKLLAQTSEVKVGFGSSKFSTYALAYKDTEKPVDPDDPGKGGNGGSGNGKGGSSKGGTKTGDPNDLAGLIALMLASGGALGAMGYRRRKEH